MDDSASLLDWLNDETTRDFLAIAFLAPIAAGLVAFVGERLGVSGKIKRLEAQEKRLAIVNELLTSADLPDETRANLNAQLDDIAAELMAEFGPDEQDIGTATSRSRIPTKWEKLPLFRRTLVLPRPHTRLGWAVWLLYYYMLFSVVVLSVGLITGDIAIDGMWIGLFAYVVVIFWFHWLVRAQYRKHLRNMSERARYTLHLRKQQTTQE